MSTLYSTENHNVKPLIIKKLNPENSEQPKQSFKFKIDGKNRPKESIVDLGDCKEIMQMAPVK